jgi:hypothetical protein
MGATQFDGGARTKPTQICRFGAGRGSLLPVCLAGVMGGSWRWVRIWGGSMFVLSEASEQPGGDRRRQVVHIGDSVGLTEAGSF